MFKNSDDAAFTLIEMLVVVAIISILAGFTFPMIGSSLTAWRTERYGKSLWMSLRDAKYKAISEKRPVSAQFKIGSGGWVKFYQDVSPPGSSSWESIPGMYPMNLPDGVEIASVGVFSGDESGYACIQFNPDGTVSKTRDSAKNKKACDGSLMGNAYIHIGPPNKSLSDSNTCLFRTIYFEAFTSTPQPYFISYGAYDDFSAKMGSNPC